MADILIVYGSSHGQTEKIVRRIADRLNVEGHWATVRKGDTQPSVAGFDAYLVAGSVRFGRHQRYLEEFVRRNLGALNSGPTGFISVCGAMAGSWSRGAEEAHKYVASFLKRTGWRPRMTHSLAGGLPYTRYGFLIRWMMWAISRATGRPTDTARDWDLTDWDQVDRFAAEFAVQLPAPVMLREQSPARVS
jgi:menaquinone-dependent protoporphyrinogen oxidase